ncbi:MAG: class I adenylate-forming enzyme family protein [Acidimicrobiales bacterium]
MNLAMLAEMAASGGGDRVAIGRRHGGVSYEELWSRALRAATWFAGRGSSSVGLIDVNSEAFPIALFGAAIAGLPFSPVNYRWSDDQLRKAVARIAPATIIAGPSVRDRIARIDKVIVIERDEFLAEVAEAAPFEGEPVETDAPAVLLFTSGTSGDPKVAVLRHHNLVSYVLGTVEFLGADIEDAQLVAVPPYHIAGIANLLTSLYAGRRIIQLAAFEPEEWVEVARNEGVTHAMVVPTMLSRVLALPDVELPNLRHLSYGGGRMPLPVIASAIARFPGVDFVNAYGLTETSSTVAVLGPEDHRQAIASADPAVYRRLRSVGRPLPTVQVEVRDASGGPLPAGVPGEIHVRGEQVSGEYLGVGSVINTGGWFATKDSGWLDEEGYLFVEGRLDDVIVRGGENVSPGEVEDVLVAHPAVVDAAVVGVPDDDWGETIVAAVVVTPGANVTPEDLQVWVRERLRSSKMPSLIAIRAELPYNDNGKLLRHQLRSELTGPPSVR